ncbi:MAG: transporter [Proteobacteria bacterium]|nr:transporter [Pseudomonadota bacterium]MBU1419441.1 transporter [Pseudomonadota bacterium]MBU1454045.1 transporter [Pseudomonadota bacterium]
MYSAHVKILKVSCLGLCLLLLTGLPPLCPAQEIEARRWSHLPTDSNFAGGVYSYTEAEIYFDPVLQIKNAQMEMNTWAFRYIRTLELMHKSARIEFTQGFQEGKWSGLLSDVATSISRRGLTDSQLRFALNLYGAPPLKGEEFAAYHAKANVETIIGTGLVVHLPTGDYMDDKLINLGSNRYTFRPQIGLVHNRGPWALELTGDVWLYTDNKDFIIQNTLKQDPLYTLQMHLVHTFRPGFWAAGSIGYAYGGESAVNGEDKNDLKENLVWAISLGCPITRQVGVKVIYLGTRTQQSLGQDSDSIAVSFSFLW